MTLNFFDSLDSAAPETTSSSSSVGARADELRQIIREASDAYYNHGTSPLSDSQYDALFQELQLLEENNPDIRTADSPTQRVGAPVQAPSGKRTKHLVPMLSLPNAMSDEELVAWAGRAQRYLGLSEPIQGFCVEPKLDGNSFSLRYRKGVLERATTRGSGEEGEDKTERARHIRGIPQRLKGADVPELFEVRGEVVLPFSGFDKINSDQEDEGEEPYENPRNTAAGLLSADEPNLSHVGLLQFYAYDAVLPDRSTPSESQHELLSRLKKWGFEPTPKARCLSTLDEAAAYAAEILRLRSEPGEGEVRFDVLLDGAVIKVDDTSLQERLGATGKDPRWATARKEKGERVVTQLLGIEVALGRTGALTPRADLAPVRCGGVTVSSATLHNAEEIRRLDIRIGDWVELERSGDVIPKILRVITERRTGSEQPWSFPVLCPSCGGPVERPIAQVRKAADGTEVVVRAAGTYCENLACPDQLVRRIEYFASRPAMEIENLGPKIARQLAESGLVRDVADLFALKVEDLLTLEGFGETRATKLVEAIAIAAKERPFQRVLAALGIRHVGKTVTRLLVEHFGTLDRLLDVSLEELETIPGIGPTTAHQWVSWVQRTENRSLLERLRAAGLKMERDEEEAATEGVATSGAFAGKTVVVTGTIEGWTRDDIHAHLQKAGAKTTGSVTGSTDYLIAGEKAGSKRAKAEKLGVPILNWEEAQAMLAGE